jgi:hypothetical protein
LSSLCGGEEEEQEGSEGLLEASHAGKGAGTDKTKCGWLKVPVEDCIATTGAMTGKGCDGMGGGSIGNGVWGAVKEGEDSNVAVDGKDFGEEVGGVDKAGKEDKTEQNKTKQNKTIQGRESLGNTRQQDKVRQDKT